MIHPTAIVERGAELGLGVEVGPYAVVRAGVRIGDGTVVGAHSLIEGRAEIGRRNRLGPFAVLGTPPQHRAYRDEPTWLRIGDENEIREFATVHRASLADGETAVGSGCLLMAYSHVAHDCRLGDHVVLANGVQLGGHVTIGDHTFLGGLAAVHQHARIGAHAMVGAGSMVSQDVVPYALVAGDRARLVGINREGLQRHGFSADAMTAIRRSFRVLFHEGRTLVDAVNTLSAMNRPETTVLRQFVAIRGRGLCRPRHTGASH